ncbi:MAG: hypothetical protein DRJ64_10220 [Thermoprotei archaeon]|nr:MAG: hypothetical protein DRJ64_10220 [Thermoprotei archaeon]
MQKRKQIVTNIANLTKQLISIPSWVGDGCNEIEIGNFIYNWLKENTDLVVTKQPVVDGRFNIIAKDNSPTEILLAGHIDTVETRAGWNTNPFQPVEKNDRIFGLGSSDMKGSLTSLMVYLANPDKSSGLMALFYVDEEYDFLGIKQFIAEYEDKISPNLIISLDGSVDTIGNGCRGLIETSFRVQGKSGHAGKPELGINAITLGVNCINKLKRHLATKYSDPTLGISSLNLAYCQGGLNLENNQYGKQGNNIADVAEFVLDIRPANSKLNADRVKKLLNTYLKSAKLTLSDWSVRHDLGSWLTPTFDLKSLAPKDSIYSPSIGYIDTQMLWRSFGEPIALTIGAGQLELAHRANEYVEISSLKKSLSLIQSIIRNYSTRSL